MANVFVFSCASRSAQRHFEDTVESGVSLSRIIPFIRDEVVSDSLEAAYRDEVAYCWGGRTGGHDERYFELMAPGDLFLAYRNRSIVAAAFFVEKTEDERLGSALWPDETERPYNLVYFFSEPQFLNQPTEPLQRYFAQVYQGLRRLPTSQAILDDFGSFSNFVRKALGGTGEIEDAPNYSTIEGRRRLRLHKVIERDSRIVRAAKVQWKSEDPLLRCECCTFSFLENYGEVGDNFIEAHHRVPLSELRLGEMRQTEIEDLAPVCSNCHRMLHRGELTVAELRDRLTANR